MITKSSTFWVYAAIIALGIALACGFLFFALQAFGYGVEISGTAMENPEILVLAAIFSVFWAGGVLVILQELVKRKLRRHITKKYENAMAPEKIRSLLNLYSGEYMRKTPENELEKTIVQNYRAGLESHDISLGEFAVIYSALLIISMLVAHSPLLAWMF